MKKLLLVGGNNIHTLNFCKLIESYFTEILLITDCNEGLCKDLPHKVIRSTFRPPTQIFRASKQIAKIISEFKPDIIHVLQIDAAAFCTSRANRKKKVPLVTSALGSDILINPEKSIFLKKMVQYVLNRSNYTTSDSEFMGEKIKTLAKNINVCIANFGIDITESKQEKQKIIYSNRLHKPLYRIDAIIKSFHDFSVKNPDWKLIVGAIGEESDFLKKLSSDLSIDDKVEFVGWLDKEKNSYYYSIAQYWVSIPKSDATAISLLEAMSFGCTPIVSDLPANREWIKHNENGFIVNDVNSDFITQALKSNFEKAGELNKKIVKEKATKAVNREKFFTIYNKLTGNE